MATMLGVGPQSNAATERKIKGQIATTPTTATARSSHGPAGRNSRSNNSGNRSTQGSHDSVRSRQANAARALEDVTMPTGEMSPMRNGVLLAERAARTSVE